MRISLTPYLIAFGLLFFACSETEFGAGSGSKGNPDKTSGEPPATDSEPPVNEPCLDGDAINLKFPPAIQACIDDGNIYDFDRSKCSNVRKADWTCDWGTLNDEMADIGTSSAKVKGGRDDGNKLVSCGQSDSGDLIVAQWWDAERSEIGDCDFGSSKMLIVTGCYGDLPTNEDTDNLSEEERQKVVSDCLKILTD